MPSGQRRGNMFTAADIAKLFRCQSVTEEERLEKGWYIYSTMMGSNWEAQGWHLDFVPFNQRYRPRWDLLYKRWLESSGSERPVFREDRLDFIDGSSHRIISTFSYPNAYTAPTVAPQTSSQTE